MIFNAMKHILGFVTNLILNKLRLMVPKNQYNKFLIRYMYTDVQGVQHQKTISNKKVIIKKQ